jgi:recombination protein RecT
MPGATSNFKGGIMMANLGQTESGKLAKSLSTILNSANVRGRFERILGAKAAGFISSIISTVNGNAKLKEIAGSNPESIVRAAAVAAALDLPIDPNLGFACIVPYGKEAQFQMEYKGYVQLALRTGQYKGMNVAEVYEDEMKFYNPITGEVEFTAPETWKQRDAGQEDKIIGYYFWFRLTNGFEKGVYWSKAKAEQHGKKYSKSYGYDLREGKKESIWTKDFHAAGKKTAIKDGLRKWGILSVDMQTAIKFDQAVVKSDDLDDPDAFAYVDNPERETIDTTAEVGK